MKFINQGFAISAGLVAGSVLAISASSAQAAVNTPITVDAPTTVEFNFLGSNGLYRSDLGVYDYNGGTPIYLGTILLSEAAPGYTSENPDFPGEASIGSSTYTFNPGTYALGLTSFIVNPDASQTFINTVFYGPTNSIPGDAASVFNSPLIRFDDDGAGPDRDYNDFRFSTTTVASVPEPTTLAGLGLVAGALAFSRRRKVSKTV